MTRSNPIAQQPLGALGVLVVSILLSSASFAQEKRPNILFAIADDATWSTFSAYGCRFASTPNFDRVAREGALFTHCFTPLPKCSPSRAAILTGKNPWQLEEAADHFGIFPAKFKVFPDILESAGYTVGYTGKGWGPGDWKKGGFNRNPAGKQIADAKLEPPTTGINTLDYAGSFAAFLQSRPQDKPFCFWYGGTEPHRPYEKGTGLKSGKKLEDAVVPPYLPDDPIVRSDLLDYAREIEWFDEQLGRILKHLEGTGQLDNTIVVVTADNGMAFPRVKGHMFEDGCHLPLAIRYPALIKPNRTIDDFVSFIDFAPTFLELVGVAQPQPMTGRSLVSLFKGTSDTPRDHIILGREREDLGRPGDVGYPVRCIRTKDFWYSRNFAPDRWPCGDPETGYTDTDESPTKSLVIQMNEKGESKYYNLAMAKRPAEELYDLKSDPSCINNIAADPKYASIKAEIWKQLESELRAQQDPRILGHGDIFDTYENTGNRKRAWDTVMGKKNAN